MRDGPIICILKSYDKTYVIKVTRQRGIFIAMSSWVELSELPERPNNNTWEILPYTLSFSLMN